MPLSLRDPLRPSRDRGFTLIELLVVIIIVGMLSSIAIPSFLGQRRRGVDASMKTDARTVATHLEAFWIEHEAYPDPLAVPPEAAFSAPTLSLGGEEIRLSPDNIPQIWLDGSDGVCVQVVNPKSTDPVNGFVWRIGAGGLQPVGSTCVDYPTPLL